MCLGRRDGGRREVRAGGLEPLAGEVDDIVALDSNCQVSATCLCTRRTKTDPSTAGHERFALAAVDQALPVNALDLAPPLLNNFAECRLDLCCIPGGRLLLPHLLPRCEGTRLVSACRGGDWGGAAPPSASRPWLGSALKISRMREKAGGTTPEAMEAVSDGMLLGVQGSSWTRWTR